jgi:hypothetical protein
VQPQDKAEGRLGAKVERTAQESAKRKLSPEFIGDDQD